MSDEVLTEEEARRRMLELASDNITFDGFSDLAFRTTANDAGVSIELAKSAFPKGIHDLGVEMHMAADRKLQERLAAENMDGLRYSEKVARAVMLRLEIAASTKEAVRRAASYFALPQNAGAGAKCIWNTADTIWNALGDTSDDLNWYSKRTILSAVYSSSLLYWLGDDTPDLAKTKAFVDRRIANVMQFEKTKSEIKSSRLYQAFRSGPGRFLDSIKAPGLSGLNDLPGQWRGK